MAPVRTPETPHLLELRLAVEFIVRLTLSLSPLKNAHECIKSEPRCRVSSKGSGEAPFRSSTTAPQTQRVLNHGILYVMRVYVLIFPKERAFVFSINRSRRESFKRFPLKRVYSSLYRKW